MNEMKTLFERMSEAQSQGASIPDQALVSDEARSGLHPTGFDPSRLLDLADRCEQETGPNRELDALIYRAVAGFPTGHWYTFGDTHYTDERVPFVTASFDAAMTLVFGTLYGLEISSDAQDRWYCQLSTHLAEGTSELAATKELAFCAAVLRARAASGTPTRRAETLGSVGEADGGPAPAGGDAQ